jgi:hypothetical protein
MKYSKYKERLAKVYSPRKNKHVAVLKATGLGISELILRFIAWLCLRDNELKGTQIILFTGPRLELAISLIRRLKEMFAPHSITFTDKETVCVLNGVRIEAYPSHHAATARGLPNVSLIFVDEASFIPNKEMNEVYDIIMRNVTKSNPYVIVVSTPNKPGDFLYKIMKEPLETSIFKKLYLDYTYGENKIYSKEDVDKIKNSSSFNCEFALKFEPEYGNVYSEESISRAIELGKKYMPSLVNVNTEARHIMGVDPGFGSSEASIVILEYSDSIIKVVYADSFERMPFNDLIHKVWELRNIVGVSTLSNVYIDMANTEAIEAIKRTLGENSNWHYIHERLQWAKSKGLNIAEYMTTVPVSFATEGAAMLVRSKELLDDPTGIVAINPANEKMIAALRSAIASEYKVDKDAMAYSDVLDAFRLACKSFNIKRKES